MGDLKRRLERLEAGSGRPCPECGLSPHSPIEYVVEWEPAPTEEELRAFEEWRAAGGVLPKGSDDPVVTETRCTRCGRVTATMIEWGGEQEEPLERIEALEAAQEGGGHRWGA